MNRCFSNSKTRKDWLKYEMEKFGENVDVFIAVAYFTDSGFIKKLVEHSCKVWIVVLLDYPTDATRLKELLSLPDVYVRYFTKGFHPKLYIYGNDIAFVGSSNLTDKGLVTNLELNVSIPSDDPEFDVLKEIFHEIWEDAQVLTSDIIDRYSQIISHMYTAHNKTEREITEKIGSVTPSGGVRPPESKSKLQEFTESYLKRYQIFLGEFEKLKIIYEALGNRKFSEQELPLRIEIDQFLSWIRETKARGDSFQNVLIKTGKDLSDYVSLQINEFISSDFQYINLVAREKYPKIKKNFSSIEKIDSLTTEEMIDTLFVVHAFIERLRFYVGGKETLKEEFLKENTISNIKNTIKYLLFGKKMYVERIADCIFDPNYRLKYFGQSCVQETYGWANNTETPICNERTLKSMQWLGFGKL